MLLWLDVQLPPSLAGWLAERFGVDAIALGHSPYREATDHAIFRDARSAGAIVVSKDRDFAMLASDRSNGPPVIWLTCGNVTNARLREILSGTLQQALDAIEAGERLVEISGAGEQRQ